MALYMRLPQKNRTLANIRSLRSAQPARLCLQITLGLFLCAVTLSNAQSTSLSEQIANTMIQSNPVGKVGAWDAETGMRLQGLDSLWYNTANGDYFRYEKSVVDGYLSARVPITTGHGTTDTLESDLLGRQLLLLYRVTLDAKYYKAASEIREHIAAACGLSSAQQDESQSKIPCMAEPFLAEYASVFHQPQDFAGIARNFRHWEEIANAQAKKQEEASIDSGDLSRSLLSAALVDALSCYPQDDAERSGLIAMLNRVVANALLRQNGKTGLFDESSRSVLSMHRSSPPMAESLLVYSLAKGARLGYLPETDMSRAERAWQEIQKHFALPEADDSASLLAAAEMDHASTASLARGETVMLDAWYNSQKRTNAAGQLDYFHYKWSDLSDSGYSLLENIFQSYGATTETLYSAPTQSNLEKAQFYIIVSPDIPVKNPNPNYMTEHDAEQIAGWVKNGGVLILMENDPPNADISHLNLLSDRFGVHFDDVLHHHIIGEQVEDGQIPVAPDGLLFHHSHTLYMKDTSAISLRDPAVALLRDRGDVIMATAKYGRGMVFAAVDPWLYNEYTDGRKNPQIYNRFDNFAGGKELVQWLLQERPR